jgi:hypothetical protein
MRKDVRIRGYYSKPKRAREQKSLEKTDLDIFSVQSIRPQDGSVRFIQNVGSTSPTLSWLIHISSAAWR